MKELLHIITSIHVEYNKMGKVLTFDKTQRLSELLSQLVTNLVFLEEERDHISRQYYATIYNLTNGKDQMATSRAEAEAKHLHPEKRKLDRFILASNRCADSMRSNISYLKQEK